MKKVFISVLMLLCCVNIVFSALSNTGNDDGVVVQGLNNETIEAEYVKANTLNDTRYIDTNNYSYNVDNYYSNVTQNDSDIFCPAVYDPFCAKVETCSNGVCRAEVKTFSNKCEVEKRGAKVIFKGACEENHNSSGYENQSYVSYENQSYINASPKECLNMSENACLKSDFCEPTYKRLLWVGSKKFAGCKYLEASGSVVLNQAEACAKLSEERCDANKMCKPIMKKKWGLFGAAKYAGCEAKTEAEVLKEQKPNTILSVNVDNSNVGVVKVSYNFANETIFSYKDAAGSGHSGKFTSNGNFVLDSKGNSKYQIEDGHTYNYEIMDKQGNRLLGGSFKTKIGTIKKTEDNSTVEIVKAEKVKIGIIQKVVLAVKRMFGAESKDPHSGKVATATP